jgi:hypothetical protein
MPIRLTDAEIARLVAERKPLPDDYRSRLQVRPKRGHRERELELEGAAGGQFLVILRQSDFNPLDFSVILGYRLPGLSTVFRLRRYNGRSHQHTNRIEGEEFYGFHVHEATERYQALGAREDTYARPTTRYGDFGGAVDCLLEDCGFSVPEGSQGRLF